jgi:hypothetical protein
MILPVLLGSAWGLLAAAVHFILLRRTIAQRSRGGTRLSPWTAHASMGTRIGAVGGMLLGGTLIPGLRLDVGLVVYAISHLVATVIYGIRVSRGGL